MLFNLIQKMSERFIPSFLMNFLEYYTNKRIAQLKHEQIKSTWQKMYLKEAKEQIQKAPTE